MRTHAFFSTAALAGVLALAGCDAASPNQASSLSTAAPVTAGAQAAGQAVPDQYIVVFNDRVADAPGLARRLMQSQGGELLHTYEHAIKGFAFRGSAQAAAALENNPNVSYVEQDKPVSIVTTQSNATWGLDRSDARSGLDGSYTYNATGAGVHAYIVDTGIRLSHNEFSGRIGAGYDAVTSGGNADDCNGHGTHVAGTVGGTTYGIAKDVRLYPVRVLDCNGSGTISGVVAGVDWVTAKAQKPAVANMSLGGGTSTTLDDAVANSIASGVSYAIAAGNGDRLGRQQDACNSSPARVPEAITISATDNSDTKASWANYGSCVDFFAPGVSITSAWYTGDTAKNTISGTSMAAPHVAGAAALYLETNTSASPQTVRDALYSATTKSIVSNSSTANNHLLYTLGSSDGGGSEPSNAAPSASFSFTTSGLTASFADGSSDSDGSVVGWAWSFGDGASSSTQNPSHTYAADGTYTVTLTVTDDGGATASASQNVSVSGGSDSGCPPGTSPVGNSGKCK